MSHHSYEQSKKVYVGHTLDEPPAFSALIMAAARKADSMNFARLLTAFPDIVTELQRRYDAPGGLLPGEGGHRPVPEDEANCDCEGGLWRDPRTGALDLICWCACHPDRDPADARGRGHEADTQGTEGER